MVRRVLPAPPASFGPESLWRDRIFSLLFSRDPLLKFGIGLTPAEVLRLRPSHGQQAGHSLKSPPWARTTLNLHKSSLLPKVGQQSGFPVLLVPFMWALASFHSSEGRGACLISPLLIFWVSCSWRHGEGWPAEAGTASLPGPLIMCWGRASCPQPHSVFCWVPRHAGRL